MIPGKEDSKKFIFSLFDFDSNGQICPRDLQAFFIHFGGTCSTVMEDIFEMLLFLEIKRDKRAARIRQENLNIRKKIRFRQQNEYEDKKPT